MTEQETTMPPDTTMRGALLRACREIDYALFKCGARLNPEPEDAALQEEIYRVAGQVAKLAERAGVRDTFFEDDARPRSTKETLDDLADDDPAALNHVLDFGRRHFC